MSSISLEHIGSRLERSGFLATCTLLSAGELRNLQLLSLRHASWLSKKQIVALLRAVERGGCPLQELVLAQTHLCITAFGHYSVDAVHVLCEMLTKKGNVIRKLDLRGTCFCGTPQDAHTGYTLAGVEVLTAALVHKECCLESLDMSENSIRAEKQEPLPSALPPSLYKIGKADVSKLAGLHPQVRSAPARALRSARRGCACCTNS